jgi:hypothetical protein
MPRKSQRSQSRVKANTHRNEMNETNETTQVGGNQHEVSHDVSHPAQNGVSHDVSHLAPNGVSHGREVPANENERNDYRENHNSEDNRRHNRFADDMQQSANYNKNMNSDHRRENEFSSANEQNDDCAIWEDIDDSYQNKYPRYVNEIIDGIRKSGISPRKIPMDGDCGIHSIIASLQINSNKYDLTAEELMSKINLGTGSGYWWSIEELSTIVSKIGFGLFAIEIHNDRKVLHFFNAQKVVKKNVFLQLKNNHYEVIDLKRTGGLDFGMICEITQGTPDEMIQSSIFQHLSKRLNTANESKTKIEEIIQPQEDQWIDRRNDYNQNDNQSAEKSNRFEKNWRLGLKKSKIHTFKPYKDPPEKFLTQIEWEFELNEVPKIHYIEAMKYFLDPTDGSFLWYQKHCDEFNGNWRMFAHAFKDNYSLHHSIDQKSKEYFDMTFEFNKGITFHDYVWKIHRLAKELNPLSSFKNVIDRVENSVPYVLRNAIMSCQPTNEEKLIKLGSRLEKDMAQKWKNIRNRFETKVQNAELDDMEQEQYDQQQYAPDYDQINYDEFNSYYEEEIEVQNANYQGQPRQYQQNYQGPPRQYHQQYQGQPKQYQQSFQDRQKFYEQRKLKAKNEGLCYKCHERGHLSAACPKSNNASALTKENVIQPSGNGQRETKQ